jgi:hypothetical protein
MNISSRLNQSATYWGNPQQDAYGGFTYDSPVLLDCHFEYRKEVFKDPQGREVRSEAQVFLSTEVDEQGYIAFGDYTGTPDPADVDTAYEIQIVEKFPSVDGEDQLVKVWL